MKTTVTLFCTVPVQNKKQQTGGESMSLTSRGMIPEEMRISIVRVYSYQNKNLQGTFYNPYYGKEIVFENITQLLLLMEDMMDEMGSPQASIQARSFEKVPHRLEKASIAQQLLLNPQQEAIAVFNVKVLFRQGASWQGKVRWTDEGKETSFRSVLELIKLMDSALPQSQVCEQVAESKTAGVG